MGIKEIRGTAMQYKEKCLELDDELRIVVLGNGRYKFYQVFKGQFFFSKPFKNEFQAWENALEKLTGDKNVVSD